MEYKYSMSLETTYYTTVTASSEEEAEKIAMDNFFNFENIEEGDAEWTDSLELEEQD
jgi:hypothetical protein